MSLQLCAAVVLLVACSEASDAPARQSDGTAGAAGSGAMSSLAGRAAVAMSGALPQAGFHSEPSPPNASLSCRSTTGEGLERKPVPCAVPIVWSRVLPSGSKGSQGASGATDAHGNVYVAVDLVGETDWGGQKYGRQGATVSYIASYSNDGDLRWVYAAEGLGVAQLDVSASQVCVTTGPDFSRAQLPSLLNPNESGRVAVLCLSLDGIPRWSRRVDLDFFDDMAFDGTGNIFVLHRSAEGPGSIRNATVAHLTSLSAEGEPRWTKIVSHTALNFASIVSHPNGSVILVLEYADTVEIGGETLRNPNGDLQRHATAVVSLDSDANPVWSNVQPYQYVPWAVVSPTGDIVVTLDFRFVHRFDSTGKLIVARREVLVDGALSNSLLGVESLLYGERTAWRFTSVGLDLLNTSVTTYTPDGFDLSVAQGAFRIPELLVAKSGEVFVVAERPDSVAEVLRIMAE